MDRPSRKRRRDDGGSKDSDPTESIPSSSSATVAAAATTGSTTGPTTEIPASSSSLGGATSRRLPGMIDFSISEIRDQFVCGLCYGFYKDPYTIAECLHTFCKSCLFYSVACGCHECPECRVYLGTDVPKFAMLDNALKELIDRVVIPKLAKDEEEEERKFYADRGIGLKPEYALKEEKAKASKSDNVDAEKSKTDTTATTTNNSNSNRNSGSNKSHGSRKSANKHTNHNDEIEFKLSPHEPIDGNPSLPPLKLPNIRVSGKFRMNQIKKYLYQKLDIPKSKKVNVTPEYDNISDGYWSHEWLQLEILCNGATIGDEHSLTFVKKCVWRNPSDLELTYRYKQGY